MYKISKNKTLKMLMLINTIEDFDNNFEALRKALDNLVTEKEFDEIINSLPDVTDGDMLNTAIKSFVNIVAQVVNTKE